MFRKIKLNSKKLLQKRKLRNRFVIKINNKKALPRLSIYRSGNHLYAQIIDDIKSITLAASSTISKDIKTSLNSKACNINAAKLIGKDIAKKALENGVKEVVFDRGGFAYHGRIKALADSARENGLKF